MSQIDSTNVSKKIRAVVYTLGTLGDVLPFISLSRELKNRGMNVTILTCDKFKAQAEVYNLDFCSIATTEDFEHVYSNAGVWSNRAEGMKLVFDRFYGPAIVPTIRYIEDLKSRKENIIVIGWGAENGAAFACQRLGIPYYGVFLAPGAIRSCHSPHFPLRRIKTPWPFKGLKLKSIYKKIDSGWWGNVCGQAVNKALTELGYPELKSADDFRCLGYAKKLIGFFPEWFSRGAKDWPDKLKMVGFPFHDTRPDEEFRNLLDNFVDKHGSPIVFTAGTGVTSVQGYFDVASIACQELGLPSVFLNSSLENKIDEKTATLSYRHAEMSYLLSRSRLIVHHGGIGTCAEAFKCGVPQVIFSRAFDQFDNGDLVTSLGVGTSLPYANYSVYSVRKAIEDVLEEYSNDKHSDLKCSNGAAIAAEYICEDFQ